MIRAYAEANGRLVPRALPAVGLDGLVWVDLIAPTPEEEARVEAALGLDIPTRGTSPR